MKDVFSEYSWLIIVGVIAALVISGLVPQYVEAITTATIQAVSTLAEHLNGLITAL